MFKLQLLLASSLLLCFDFFQNNFQGAKSYVQQCIHKNPSQSSLWQLLSQLLQRHYPVSLAPVAASCADCAYRLNPFLDVSISVATVVMLTSLAPVAVSCAYCAYRLNPFLH